MTTNVSRSLTTYGEGVSIIIVSFITRYSVSNLCISADFRTATCPDAKKVDVAPRLSAFGSFGGNLLVNTDSLSS